MLETTETKSGIFKLKVSVIFQGKEYKQVGYATRELLDSMTEDEINKLECDMRKMLWDFINSTKP